MRVIRSNASKISFNENYSEDAMNELTKRSDGQKMGFEKAQEARRTMRTSPVERHREKVKEALRWIHGWQQSTAEITRIACRSSSTAFLSSMREAGLLRTERVLAQTFWLLTKNGLDLLRDISGPDDELAKLTGTRNVNLHAFGHNVTAQRVLAQKIKAGGEGGRWWCDRQLRSLVMSEAGAKCPDAAYMSPLGDMTYIEVERSRKKQPELESMMLALARLLESKHRAIAEVYIEPGIADRYKSTIGGWLSRKEFRAWSESTEGELYQNGVYNLNDSLRDAIMRIKFVPTRIFV